MPAGPLARKLQLKPGHRLAVVNPPSGYLERLEPTAAGAQLAGELAAGLDAVHVFVRDTQELDSTGPAALQAVKPGGLLWVCYPKGGVKAGTDLNRDILWERMSRLGLVGVTLVAVDATWSAMRFRPAEDRRP